MSGPSPAPMECRSSSSLRTNTLLTIPVELRELILKALFRSTTVYHGFEYCHDEASERISSEPLEDATAENTHSESCEEMAPESASVECSDKSTSDDVDTKPPNHVFTQNTSILRTCRQLYNEAGPLLTPNILLHFASTATMLDTMTTLPPSTIESLRYMRLKSYPFPLRCDDHYYTTFNMSSTLPMFPGLQLDVLTVEDCFHDPGVNDGWGDCGTYYDIGSLLREDGWKELHYITPTTEFMTSQNDAYKDRVAQPTGWNKMLREKDGETSGAGVRMYIANQKSLAGLAEDPFTRSLWEAVPGHLLPPPPPPDLGSFEGGWGNWVDSREVVIVAKRGAGAKHIQDGRSMRDKIKRLLDQMSWAELKKSGKYIPPEDDACAHL